MNWDTCTEHTNAFVSNVRDAIQSIVAENVGIYLHGSLAMDGFNPKKSDVDLLVITEHALTNKQAKKLSKYLLQHSSNPYPIEISVLNEEQLIDWQHPSPFDYHFSEDWRGYFEKKVQLDDQYFVNGLNIKDVDLAAHLTITYHRGVCLAGLPIKQVIPLIPKEHYLSAIMEDFESCLQAINDTPVYSVLNLLRVYRYIKEEHISSKREGGEWALRHFPSTYHATIQKVLTDYQQETQVTYDQQELKLLSDYVRTQVESIMGSKLT